ncbi:hypothetical protein PCANC_23715 [Puccinia coronata f. sp. avenae]|uniref:Uncharacterized protein n=1 Tax=Puccinia coronata f. sp. avenae TaxID=200324 RepID=A0A2N5TYP1_9BASI|nr:hypothetical protein PCANC_23715 [Puccinia coronata f. sp. avenae]
MAMEDIYLLNLSQPQPAIRRDRYHMSTMKSINRIATLLYLENLPQHPRKDDNDVTPSARRLRSARANKIRTEESPVVYHFTHPFTIRVLNSGLARKSSTSLILTVNYLKNASRYVTT